MSGDRQPPADPCPAADCSGSFDFIREEDDDKGTREIWECADCGLTAVK